MNCIYFKYRSSQWPKHMNDQTESIWKIPPDWTFLHDSWIDGIALCLSCINENIKTIIKRKTAYRNSTIKFGTNPPSALTSCVFHITALCSITSSNYLSATKKTNWKSSEASLTYVPKSKSIKKIGHFNASCQSKIFIFEKFLKIMCKSQILGL